MGAGPAGGVCSECLLARPQRDAFDAAGEIGGQFNIAKQIPGKEEFYETLRYYRRMIDLTGVELRLNQFVSAADLIGFDEVIGKRDRTANACDRRYRSSKSAELSRRIA